jgi:hypothetical protein
VSSHLRFGITAFFLVAGFTTPAASNVLTDLFTPSAAPEQPAAAAAPAKEECLTHPGQSTAAGQHWVYRFDGQRRCWFQAAEETAPARKQARHRVAPPGVAARERDKPAPRQPENVEDAHAEMLNSAPQQTPQAAAPEPKLTIVRTIPVRVSDAAGQVPPAPDLNISDAAQLATDQQAPRQLDVDQLLAHAPAESEETAYTSPPPLLAIPGADTAGRAEWIASWLGLLLIALGGAALLSSSPALLRAVWPARLARSGTVRPAFAHGGPSEPFFGSGYKPQAGGGRDEMLRYDPQSVAPLDHAARASRAAPPEPPSREAVWDEEIDALSALAQIRFVGPLPPGLREG